MDNWCISWLSRRCLLGILIFKGLTARRLYTSFGVKGLKMLNVFLYEFSAWRVFFFFFFLVCFIKCVGSLVLWRADGSAGMFRCPMLIVHLFGLRSWAAHGPTSSFAFQLPFTGARWWNSRRTFEIIVPSPVKYKDICTITTHHLCVHAAIPMTYPQTKAVLTQSRTVLQKLQITPKNRESCPC
jgi:hypothetical protein